jgi:membrane protein DedA with SNARE-associated domain
VEKVWKLLEKYHTLLIIGFRFFYGLRTVTPFAIGVSGFNAKRFVVLNAIGAVLWATTVAAGGYVFGQALEIVIGDIKHFEFHILMAMVCIGVLIWLIHLYRRKERVNPLDDKKGAGLRRQMRGGKSGSW